MESQEQKLIREALEDQNQQAISEFKNRARCLMSAIVTKQASLAKLLADIEADKKALRELKLTQLDAKEVL